jgi:hypothetical protein
MKEPKQPERIPAHVNTDLPDVVCVDEFLKVVGRNSVQITHNTQDPRNLAYGLVRERVEMLPHRATP